MTLQSRSWWKINGLPCTRSQPADTQQNGLPAQPHQSSQPRNPPLQISTIPDRAWACWGWPAWRTAPTPADTPGTTLQVKKTSLQWIMAVIYGSIPLHGADQVMKGEIDHLTQWLTSPCGFMQTLYADVDKQKHSQQELGDGISCCRTAWRQKNSKIKLKIWLYVSIKK